MGSLSVQIFSAIYLIVLIIIYFSKKRINSIENKIFSSLIITNLIGVILDLISTSTALYMKDAIWLNIVSKFYLVYLITWLLIFTLYVYYISTTTKKNKKENKMYYKLKKYIIIIDFIISTLVLILPLHNYSENGIVYTYGMSANLTYLVAGICILLWIICLLINIKNVINKKFIPLFAFIIFGSIAALIQAINPQILLVTAVFIFVNFLMYFTIENPDVKMLSELEYAKNQAEKANNAKTDFLSSMSHEIRTPLNAIVGFSECIASSDDIVSARSDAKDIIMASQNLLEIVNGILDISKIEANKMEIIETDYELEPMFNNLVKLMIPRIGDKPIELKKNFAQDIPAVLHGDGGKLKQIVTNILTNAVKYTEKGQIDFTVNCINEKNTCSLIISVEDTGRGIKPDKIDKLFQKFERLDEDKNTTLEGTGLGLAITKKLIEMMGGKIIVQSKYEVGSKFTVYIKQQIVSMKKQYIEEPEKTETIDLTGKKILVVDDNKMNLKVASRILKNYNAQIFESESGIECLERIRANEYYDLILLDDMMPRMSGVETLQRLKQIPSFNIPVIALTANALEGMKEKYIKDGFNDYLSKPFNKVDLEIVIKKFIKTDKVVDTNLKPNIEIKQNSNFDYPDFSSKKILIVDDNKLNIKVAEILLKKYNFQIESVLSGKECIDKINSGNNYDLIFMDYMMPEMNGIETLNNLKQIPNFKTKVIALTADAIEGSKEKFLNAGFDEYISKPIDKSNLNDVILKFIQK